MYDPALAIVYLMRPAPVGKLGLVALAQVEWFLVTFLVLYGAYNAQLRRALLGAGASVLLLSLVNLGPAGLHCLYPPDHGFPLHLGLNAMCVCVLHVVATWRVFPSRMLAIGPGVMSGLSAFLIVFLVWRFSV